jgi:hypothetical protein
MPFDDPVALLRWALALAAWGWFLLNMFRLGLAAADFLDDLEAGRWTR